MFKISLLIKIIRKSTMISKVIMEASAKPVTKEIEAKKKKREPHQEYTFEPIVRKGKKGEIDAVAYCDKLLIDFLYFFCEEVQKANPT